MSPTSRSSTRRTASRPASGRHGAPRGGRPAPTNAPETESFAPQDVVEGPASGARPASGRASAKSATGRSSRRGAAPDPKVSGPMRNRRPTKPNYGMYVIFGLVALAVIGAVAYRPVMRWHKLGGLDQASGAEALRQVDEYLKFEQNSEAMVRDAVRSKRGPFEAQVYMAKSVSSFPALMSIAERSGLTKEELAVVLGTAAEVFSPERHKGDRVPAELPDWAEKHEDRAVAIAAMSVIVKHGGANGDPEQKASQLLQRIVAKPAQDPLRVTAALDGLTEIVDVESLGNAISLLRSGASDQVLAHAALCAKMRTTARPNHLGELVALLDHQQAPVRAFALETLGGLTMPDSADPQAREALGQRIGAKLIPATPAIELAAALKATAGMRLTGARDAVLELLPQRAQLALPGIDDSWWADCLGRALILTNPPGARPASEDQITKLTAALANPLSRSVVAKALGKVNDRNFLKLRPALDKLAELGATPECMAALNTLVAKTYDRADVSSSCGDDPARWKKFLAEDGPRSARCAEIRAFVDDNQEMVRASVGKAKLMETQGKLESAKEELQGWVDDRNFVPPLGMTSADLTTLMKAVGTLHYSVNKAMPAK